MRTVFLCALLALPSLAAAPKAKPVFPYPLKTSTLKNGLTVTRVPFNSKGLIAYVTVARVGSRNEVEPGHTGFAHFFEHMMFKGTPRYPEGTRDALLGKLGFSENAFTTNDITLYHVTGPSSALEKLVEVEADRFINLAFSEPSFQTEAKAVLGEYHKNAANPGLKLEEALSKTAFTQHTYQHTTLGFYEDIQAMPTRYEYSKQFFKRWYTPDNCMLFVVGDFDDAALMSTVEKHYGNWSGKAAQIKVPVEPEQTSARSASVMWPTLTLPRHGLYWKSPAASYSNKESAIAEVLGAYLAGPTSPLFKKLVLDDQSVERVGPDYENHRDPNLFGISATLKDNTHRAAVEAAMLDAVKEVASGKVDLKRLSAIKDNIKYGAVMGLETNLETAIALAYSAGVLGKSDALDLGWQHVAEVTDKDLVTFAKKNLTDARRTTLELNVHLEVGGT